MRKIRFNFHLSDEYDKYLIEFIQSHKNQSRIIRDLLRAGYTALQQKNTEKTDIPKDIPDNTKTYYYSLRAVDKAGNSSSLVGDGSATITTTIATQAQSENGVSEVRQLPKETNGQVLGEDRVEGPDLESTQTPSLSGIIANVTKNKPWLFVGGALLILGIAVYLFKRNK